MLLETVLFHITEKALFLITHTALLIMAKLKPEGKKKSCKNLGKKKKQKRKSIINRNTQFSGVRKTLVQRSKITKCQHFRNRWEGLTGQCLFRKGPEKAGLNRKFPQ